MSLVKNKPIKRERCERYYHYVSHTMYSYASQCCHCIYCSEINQRCHCTIFREWGCSDSVNKRATCTMFYCEFSNCNDKL